MLGDFSLNILLLEKELGYNINRNTNGIMVLERMKMLQKWNEMQEEYRESNKLKKK
jgi:hypothetical protein